MPDAASPLLAALGAAMSGTLSRFAGGLFGPEDAQASVSAERLLDAAMLATLLARAEQEADRRVGDRPAGRVANRAAIGSTGGMEPADRRAVVSEWTLTYFEAILPPLLSSAILLDRLPRIGIDRVSFAMAPDQRIVALGVSGEQPFDAAGRFDSLVSDHLTPFINQAAARGGVTRRVLWSNAGHVFEAFLGMIEHRAAGRPGLAEARALLGSPVRRDGSRNPLFQPVRYVNCKRMRRVCCLRFLVPAWRVCAICPVHADNPARARFVDRRHPAPEPAGA